MVEYNDTHQTNEGSSPVEKSIRVIEGNQVIELNGQFFISLTEAMSLISPQSSNAARWFTLRQKLFKKEVDFVYSDMRFPGKVGRIWIKLPQGLMTLLRVCKEATRLKIADDIEERLALFLLIGRDGIPDRRFSTSEEQGSKGAGEQGSRPATPAETPAETPADPITTDDLEIEFETAKEQVGMGAEERMSGGAGEQKRADEQMSGGAGEQKSSPAHLPTCSKCPPAPLEGESKKAGKQERQEEQVGPTPEQKQIMVADLPSGSTGRRPSTRQDDWAKRQGAKEPDVPKTREQSAPKTHPHLMPAQSLPSLAIKRPPFEETLEDISKLRIKRNVQTATDAPEGLPQTATDAPEGLPQTATDAPKGLRFSTTWCEVKPKLVECVSEFSQRYHQKFVVMNRIMNEAPEEIYNILEDAEKTLREKMVMEHVEMIRDIIFISGIISTETQ